MQPARDRCMSWIVVKRLDPDQLEGTKKLIRDCAR